MSFQVPPSREFDTSPSRDLDALGLAQAVYENDVLSKVKGYVSTGQEWWKKEPSFQELPGVVQHVNGDYTTARPKSLSQVSDNRTQKVMVDLASALSEVRPIWNYETYRAQFKRQAEVFSKCARYWWKHSYADRSLLYAIMNAEAGGSGFLLQQWNSDLPGAGDVELVPFGVQDVLPIGPAYTESIQSWQGVILRQTISVEALVNEYPSKERAIRASRASWVGNSVAPKKGWASVFTTAYARLFNTSQDASPSQNPEGMVDLLWVWIKDYAIHTGTEPRLMGEPDKSWSYTVKPGERLYPRGRFIKCVEQAVLQDGPNEYWHGLFPITRLSLLPTPWSLLGLSVLSDFTSLQSSLNDVLRGLEDNVNQKLRPAIVTNSSMAQNKMNALDMRQPGQKIRVNIAAGEQFEIKEMPDLPSYVMDYIKFLKDEIDENSGVQTLRMLAQMKQMPSSDSLDKILDAMSPKLQLMASSIEIALAEIATMFLANVMQFYTLPRRYQMLGKDGVTMEDFDFDPNTMVPAAPPGASDSLQERSLRAMEHFKNFIFSVERNTFLSVTQTTRQLQLLQLFQRGACDIWTLLDGFDLPAGPEPGPDVIQRLEWAKKKGLQPGLTEEIAQAQQALVMIQAQQAMMQAGMQQMMGGGAPPGGAGGAPPGPPGPSAPNPSGVGPQGGRPPTATAPPQLQTKNGPEGPRQVLSQSATR